MYTVGILGSCVTRDAFELVCPKSVELVMYYARTSLASLFAKPVTHLIKPQQGKAAPFELKSLERDWDKTFVQDVIKASPDVLVLDFIDERFGICLVDGSVFCATGELTRFSWLDGGPTFAATLPKTDEKAIELWASGLKQFSHLIAERLPSTRVVINNAKFALRFKSASGSLEPFPENVRNWSVIMNRLLERMINETFDALPSAKVINFTEELLVADECHRWGLQPFHYIPAYYSALAEIIQSL